MSLGQRDLGAQDLFLLDDPFLGQLSGHVQVVLAATDGLRGDAVQRSGAKQLVIRDRNLVGDRLVGSLGLESGDIDGDVRLAVKAESPSEVADQPLEPQLGQFVTRLTLETNGNRAQQGEDGEFGRVRVR